MNNPKWFDLSVSRIERMMEFYRTGFVYPLAERDSEGRRVIFINQPKVDADVYNSDDIFHLTFTVAASLLLEEETQISGLTFVSNHENVTMKYISLFSVEQFLNIVKFMKNSSSGRFKSFYLVNLPSLATFLWNSARAAMSDKLKNRMVLVKNLSELNHYLDTSLLAKEFGGEKFSEAEMMEKFEKYFDKNLNLLRRVNEFEINLENLSADDEKVGSFRKLEID